MPTVTESFHEDKGQDVDKSWCFVARIGGGMQDEEEEAVNPWMFSFHPQLTCLYLSKELVDARVKMDRESNRRETYPDDARIRCE